MDNGSQLSCMHVAPARTCDQLWQVSLYHQQEGVIKNENIDVAMVSANHGCCTELCNDSWSQTMMQLMLCWRVVLLQRAAKRLKQPSCCKRKSQQWQKL